MKCAGCGAEIPKELTGQLKQKKRQKIYCCTQCAHKATGDYILLDGCY